MSRNGTLLPIPERPIYAELIEAWPQFQEAWPPWQFPRSKWLGSFEYQLRIDYPQSSSADRRLTARHYAPFPLKDGPNVP